MKLFMTMMALVGFMALSSNASAAIGCLPGECGGGPRPSPTPPRPHCPNSATTLMNVFAVQGCQTQTVENCSLCGADATGCLNNHDSSGNPAGFSCVYCAGSK